MNTRTVLKLLFATILVAMLAVTGTATLKQPLWEWQGLVREPDRWWTLATLADAYFGFLTFYVWVWFKERTAGARAGWLVAIMLLGNIAMSIYVLRQLARWRDDQPVAALLLPEAARTRP
jgi:hypothetical protein